MEKGHTLNSLGRTKFDLSMSTMMNPSSTVPKAVKRIHEIYDKPTFLANISGSDVKQGSLGDCWLMASFSGLANVENGIQRICVEYDTRIGIYGFVFYRGKCQSVMIRVPRLTACRRGVDLLHHRRQALPQIALLGLTEHAARPATADRPRRR
jgi:hypothetical protein